MSVSRRLQRLEQVIRPVKHDESRLDEQLDRVSRWMAGWALLMPSMAPEHVARVETVMHDELFGVSRILGPEHPLMLSFRPWALSEADPLAGAVDVMIQRTRGTRADRWTGPFVLPAVIAEVYSANEHARPDDKCLHCGLLLPQDSGRRFGEVQPRLWQGYSVCDPISYFASGCPVCGGPVEAGRGRWTNRRIGERVEVPADLIDDARDAWRPLLTHWFDEIAVENASQSQQAAGAER